VVTATREPSVVRERMVGDEARVEACRLDGTRHLGDRSRADELVTRGDPVSGELDREAHGSRQDTCADNETSAESRDGRIAGLAARRTTSIVCLFSPPGPAQRPLPRSPQSQEQLRGSPLFRLGRGLPQGAARVAGRRRPRARPAPERARRLGRALRVRPELAAQALRRGLCGDQLAQGVRRPRRVAHRAARLLRGDHARARAVRRRQLRGTSSRRADDHGRGHSRARRSATSARSSAASRSGARDSRSRAQAPTSRRSRRARCATATTTS
jgi:hypothetical protein